MVNRWMHIDGRLSLVREMAGEVNRLEIGREARLADAGWQSGVKKRGRWMLVARGVVWKFISEDGCVG